MSEKKCRLCGGDLESTVEGDVCKECGGQVADAIDSEVNIMSEEETAKAPQNNFGRKAQLIFVSVLLFIVTTIVAIFIISNYLGKIGPIKSRVEIIENYVQSEKYEDALEYISDYKDDYMGEHKKYDERVERLYTEIETMLYNFIAGKGYEEMISLGNCYMTNYPNGKYVLEVENYLKSAYTEDSVNKLREAEQDIKSQAYSSAYYKLSSIVTCIYLSESDKENAKKILKEVAPFHMIIGTWKKMTGVSYTFEADGSMSTDLSPNYNQAAGTTTDGLEVEMLLGDKEDFGRCVHGGRWNFVSVKEQDGKTYYYYNLLYNGSMHVCVVEEDKGKLGVMLSSGFGDMSVLYR